MRVVLDTNVVLCGLFSSRGASYRLLREALEGNIEILASVPLFTEYEAVLMRTTNLKKIGWTQHKMEKFLRGLASIVESVEVHYLWRPGFTAKGDEMILECAVAGSADTIVTANVRDFKTAAHQFTVEILTPAETVQRLQRSSR